MCVAQRARLRQRVAHVPRAHAQLDLLRRLVAAVLEHRVRRARTRGLVGKVESVAVEAVRGRERHVQPAVALALGPLLVDAVDVLHVEAARLVALAPQHVVATCHSAAVSTPSAANVRISEPIVRLCADSSNLPCEALGCTAGVLQVHN